MEIKKVSITSLAKSSTYMYRYYIIIIYAIRILRRYMGIGYKPRVQPSRKNELLASPCGRA